MSTEKYQNNFEEKSSPEQEISGTWEDWSARKYAWEKANGISYRGFEKESEDIILIRQLLDSALQPEDLIRWGHYSIVLRSGTSSGRGWGDSGGYADTGPDTKRAEGWVLHVGKNFCVLSGEKNTPIQYIYREAFNDFIKPRIDYLELFVKKIDEMTAKKQETNGETSGKVGGEHPFKQEWSSEKQRIEELISAVKGRFESYFLKDYSKLKDAERKIDSFDEDTSDLILKKNEITQKIEHNDFKDKLNTLGDEEKRKYLDGYNQLKKNINLIEEEIKPKIQGMRKLLTEKPNELLSADDADLNILRDKIKEIKDVFEQFETFLGSIILKINEEAVGKREAEIKSFFKEHFGACRLCGREMKEKDGPGHLFCDNTKDHLRGDKINWQKSGSGKNKGFAYLITLPTGKPGKGPMQRHYGAEQCVGPELPLYEYDRLDDIEDKAVKTIVYSNLIDEPEYFESEAEIRHWDDTVIDNVKKVDSPIDSKNEKDKEENGKDIDMNELLGKLKGKFGDKK